METVYHDEGDGYTRSRIAEIEANLIWYEENAREPQITCLRGLGIPTEPPDSPNNRRWMRLFTTMSLTLSDGYVLYTVGGPAQHHIWYPFWDADLGQPIGPTTQRYQDIEGLYIREFTNGWAVYNRSGQAQTVTLPSSATSVSDRGNNAASITHLVPDLDGEIYLKTPSLADVNRDWVKSTSWIWSKSPTGSAKTLPMSTGMESSIFWIWSRLRVCLGRRQPHLQRIYKHLRCSQR